MRISPVALMSLLLAGALSAETFPNARDGFTITVPPGWTEIPREELAQITTEGRKALPATANVPDFTYGYRAPAGDMAFPPYMLVWVQKNGRAPEAQLKALPKLDLASLANEARKSAGSLASSLAINSAAYDESTHILWATSEATYPGIGAVGILNGGIMTEEGIIWIYGYAPRDRFEQTRPALAEVIGSVQLSEALRYKPRTFDYFGGEGFSVASFLTYAVVGGIAAMIAFWIKKRRAPPVA